MSEGTRGPIGGKGVKVGSALVTPLVFQMSLGGGNRLPSGDPSTRLPPKIRKRLVILKTSKDTF